jgi:hypothetical protein
MQLVRRLMRGGPAKLHMLALEVKGMSGEYCIHCSTCNRSQLQGGTVEA